MCGVVVLCHIRHGLGSILDSKAGYSERDYCWFVQPLYWDSILKQAAMIFATFSKLSQNLLLRFNCYARCT
jgi:hypothetical protein